MTLEELRKAAQNAADADTTARQAEISRRKSVILAKLDGLGIKPEDGWILTPDDPDNHGVWVSHPDLPTRALAVLSGDGADQLYITTGHNSWAPLTAWQIAKFMGATLD
jgi:hypothetical protein